MKRDHGERVIPPRLDENSRPDPLDGSVYASRGFDGGQPSDFPERCHALVDS